MKVGAKVSMDEADLSFHLGDRQIEEKMGTAILQGVQPRTALDNLERRRTEFTERAELSSDGEGALSSMSADEDDDALANEEAQSVLAEGSDDEM